MQEWLNFQNLKTRIRHLSRTGLIELYNQVFTTLKDIFSWFKVFELMISASKLKSVFHCAWFLLPQHAINYCSWWYIWITDSQRIDPEYLNDTNNVGYYHSIKNPGLQNRPISLVRFGRNQPIKCSDSTFFKYSGYVLWGSVIHISLIKNEHLIQVSVRQHISNAGIMNKKIYCNSLHYWHKISKILSINYWLNLFLIKIR